MNAAQSFTSPAPIAYPVLVSLPHELMGEIKGELAGGLDRYPPAVQQLINEAVSAYEQVLDGAEKRCMIHSYTSLDPRRYSDADAQLITVARLRRIFPDEHRFATVALKIMEEGYARISENDEGRLYSYTVSDVEAFERQLAKMLGCSDDVDEIESRLTDLVAADR